jgi:molybdopterin-guanine dinucleotide biosynthesis protein A
MSALQTTDKLNISGLILAGGEGRRMAGRDKGLITLADKPLVEYAIACMKPLVDDLSISCNRNHELYLSYQLDCLADKEVSENTDKAYAYQGPMAGLAAGLKHACHEWLLVMPCDTPLMTTAIMAQLLTFVAQQQVDEIQKLQGVIFSHQGLQPLHGLYHRSMLPILERCLAENKNALQRLLRSMDSIQVLSAEEHESSFNNANDPEGLRVIERLLKSY